MPSIELFYGSDSMDLNLPEENLLGILEGHKEQEQPTEETVILKALANPIGSPQLKNIVKKGEKICIVISDITRLWQRMNIYLPYIVEELNNAGIEDKDITFLCATGSHRSQSIEEHRLLLGEDLAQRFQVIDHDCRDKESLAYVGETSFGTPVWINKIALNSDHIIVTGAVVYHDLVGWGGGKKSILPGIAGYESIMANHGLSLSSVEGEGTHPNVKSGSIINNPLHEDMLEATALVKPSFLFNVIMDEEGKIGSAVAGDYIEAHEVGQQLVSKGDGVFINEKADLIIASAGGFPKDINLYQSSKALSNCKEAVKPGGAIVLLCECSEGFGDDEVQYMITSFDTNLTREQELRRDYTIAKYTGFLITEIASKYNIILVSSLPPASLQSAGIRVVETLEEALAIFLQDLDEDYLAYVIPKAANILPIDQSKDESTGH